MEITNIYNLPEVLVHKCGKEKHNKPHCVSATTLKNGTRAFWLSERHWNEMKVDVSDCIWSMLGTAFHSLMEEETENTFVEELVQKKVGEWTITGRIDGYDMSTCEIYDWKTTSVWKVVNKDYDAWRFQGLVYAWLCKQNGIEVKKCRFIACLKDHSYNKARFDRSYPQHQVEMYEFDITEKDLKEIEKTILAKVKEIAENENTADEDLPMCTPEERWQKTEFAVFKNGKKTAMKCFNDKNNPNTTTEEKKQMADMYAEAVGGFVVDRSKDGKCIDYCDCCEFCTYWKERYGNCEIQGEVSD